MEPVKQEGQQLLRVLLLIARKLGGKASDLGLTIKGCLLLPSYSSMSFPGCIQSYTPTSDQAIWHNLLWRYVGPHNCCGWATFVLLDLHRPQLSPPSFPEDSLCLSLPHTGQWGSTLWVEMHCSGTEGTGTKKRQDTKKDYVHRNNKAHFHPGEAANACFFTWRAEFMKHVFPKLLSPHKPGCDCDSL